MGTLKGATKPTTKSLKQWHYKTTAVLSLHPCNPIAKYFYNWYLQSVRIFKKCIESVLTYEIVDDRKEIFHF
jgi:hypothetical protein